MPVTRWTAKRDSYLIMAAGLIVDNMNPRFVWYICGVLASVAFAGFLLLWKKQQNTAESSVDNIPNLD